MLHPVFALAPSRPVRATLALAALAALVLAPAPAASAQTAKFTGVGDLPGGPACSLVRDATKVGALVVAVGGGATREQIVCTNPEGTEPPGCNVFAYGPDTAVRWQWDGTNPPVATALPNLVNNTTAVTAIFAAAVTPDGAYVASRARSHALNGQRQAVRVTSALAPFPSANFNLTTLFTPALDPSTAAVAISSGGSILYGFGIGDGNAYRFDVAAGTSATITPPAGASKVIPAARGASSDGSVMVATAGDFGAGRAYRYVQGGGLTAVPLLAGGSWNAALAVSVDGVQVLVAGNSAAFPNGELYLFNATTLATASLGSPNSPWSPMNIGGMTADGTLVAITFGGQSTEYAYIHNSHGWFELTAALGAQGIDVAAQGWTNLDVSGVSADGTLVFGQGSRNGGREGWIAEFPAGFLAGFDAPAMPLTDTAIVGTWTPDPTNPQSIAAFMADGTYYQVEPSGFERGVYSWDGATGRIHVVTRQDANGEGGFSESNGALGLTVTITGDHLTGSDAACPTCGFEATRLTSGPGAIVAGWLAGSAAAADSSALFVMTPTGKYFYAQEIDNAQGALDGIEIGQATWDPVTHVITPQFPLLVDTNGDGGLSNPTGSSVATLTADELGLLGGDASGTTLFKRVIDPHTVTPQITSSPTAGGTARLPFHFTVTAAHALTFGATGAAWLAIDPATGVLSGTPPDAGQFTVTLTATNTLGLAGSADLVITIAEPSPTAPTVTALAPASGTTAGGTRVTISGTNFAAGATVGFGGVAATGVTVDSATQITATTPAHPAGAVDIDVTNPNAETGQLAAGYTYVAPSNCTYALAPVAKSFLAGGTSGTIAITATAGCAWSAVSSAPWLHVTSGASGLGSGTIAYTADPNPTGSARKATITAGGRTFTATEAGAKCSFRLSPASTSAGVGGASGTVTVTAAAPVCTWSTVNSASWVDVLGSGSGTGSGQVAYDVAPQTGTKSRTTTLKIGGASFKVTQAPCSFSVTPSLTRIGLAGGSGNFTVTANGSGCVWTATSNASWLHVTAGASGAGSGSVTWLADAASGTKPRTATLKIAGKTVKVIEGP